MTDRLVKSFEDMARDAWNLEDFSSDAYVEWLTKSGRLGEHLSKASGGVFYNYGGFAAGNQPAGYPGQTYPGYPNIGQQYQDLTPLRIQNLDATLTTVLFKRRNFVLWDWLEKVPSISTLYEYDKIRAYGSGRAPGGFAEGGTPALTVPRYERDQATIRYIGIQRGVTQQSRMVGRAGGLMMDPVRTEIENGTLTLLEKITRSLYFGDENVLDEAGNTVNYTGVLPQIAAQNDPVTVLDLQGNPNKFAFSLFDNIATTLVEKGFVTDFGKLNCFMNPRVLTDMSKIFYTQGNPNASGGNNPSWQRLVNNGGREWTPGMLLPGYDTNFGHFKFTPDIFLQEVPGNVPVGNTTDPGDPNAPTGSYVSGLANLVLEHAASAVSTSVPAGLWYYWASAVGAAGESAPVSLGSVAVDAGDQVVIEEGSSRSVTGAYGSVGSGVPTQYRIYRSTMANPWVSGGGSNDPSTWIDPNGGFVGHFVQPSANQGADTTYFIDQNLTIPGTGNIVILEGSTENLQVPQLTPLLKYNLPPVGTLEPFLLMIYHTIIYKAQKRAFWIRNVPVLA